MVVWYQYNKNVPVLQIHISFIYINHMNNKKLIDLLLEDVQAWSDVNLSWMGRIASVKMAVLPKLLYFRTLPIQVSVHAPWQFQSKIFHYIWGTKGSRITWATMYASKDSDGPGMSDFRKYYATVQLAQQCQLHSQHYQTDWVSIEAQACSPLTIDLVLWIPPKHRKAILCPTPSHSLHVWDTVGDGFCAPHIFR